MPKSEEILVLWWEVKYEDGRRIQAAGREGKLLVVRHNVMYLKVSDEVDEITTRL